jgi:uncharacterized protein YqgV (UPF0045/DUF77 family)
MPGHNRAELSVEITILPSVRGAKAPQKQKEAGVRAANASGLSVHEAGPDTTVLAGGRGESLDAAREMVEAALDAGASEVRIKVEAQGESAKFGSAGGRRAPAP